jgi:hypothetical protein
MLQILQQHGVREVPAGVLQLLRTWADKRERITVFASATLLEFAAAEELERAIARGLPGTRLSATLLLVTREEEIDFRHFRLLGTRDYGLPPDPCVAVAEDGVTLSVDVARADLLLETELRRFAEAVPSGSSSGRRLFRITPQSMARGRDSGLHPFGLEQWFQERTGQSVTPAIRLLLPDPARPPLEVRRLTTVHTPSVELADGLVQWPATRELIESRLGPQALVVSEENLSRLAQRVKEVGLDVRLAGEAAPGEPAHVESKTENAS